MEPLSFVLVSASAVAAWAAKAIIQSVFAHRKRDERRLEITTASGNKVTLEVAQLTREKVAEITSPHSAARVAL